MRSPPLSACARLCGWRVPPSDTTIRDFNVKLANESNGLLPTIGDPSELSIASVRCSHTNAVLRLVHGAVTTMLEELQDEQNRVSLSRVLEKQPSFAQPLKRGLRWTVIAHQLVTRCPGLMGFLANSGNADHGTARVSTTVQRAKRVWKLALQRKQLTTDEDWAVVKRIAAVGVPKEFRVEIPSYVHGWRRVPPPLHPMDGTGGEGRARGRSPGGK